ncbi:hypothetical protein Taro_054595 [Colocasia esculenta]|uniref:RNase H type-1 domain-containing protein n=1 Tax=Colocasia esculenta TaxID=4460 RepID=A0A843XQX3_COLES|nr:hypothetical protein [Colocasia esculenta]
MLRDTRGKGLENPAGGQVPLVMVGRASPVAPSTDEWQALHSFGFAPQCSSKMLKLVRWIPPLHDFSLNVDGACKGNPSDCGGGGCIRDSQGNVHLAFAHFYGVGTRMLAEIRALSDGLRLASAIGHRISIVYSDSQVIAHSMKEDRVVSWQSFRWWREARRILMQNGISLLHVYRETNQVADSLANFAILSRQNNVYRGANNLPHPCKGPVVLLIGGVGTSSPIGGGCTLLVESLRTAFD